MNIYKTHTHTHTLRPRAPVRCQVEALLVLLVKVELLAPTLRVVVEQVLGTQPLCLFAATASSAPRSGGARQKS